MKKSIFMKIAVIFGALSALVFTSCDNEIRIRANQNGVDFSYKVKAGDGFKDLLALMGEEDASGFNSEDVKSMFEAEGFSRVSVNCPESTGFEAKCELPETADDPVSKSGMLSFSVQGNFITMKVSKESLKAFYDASSQQIQNVIDMLMSPTFTEEEMTDEEYLELLASVYGQKLADELAVSKIKITLESPSGGVSKHTISLLTLLNLTGKIEFSA